MKAMALDIGLARIGVAVSDDAGILAYPLETIEVYAMEQAVMDVIDIIDVEEPEKIFIGMPTSDDGKPSNVANFIRQFTNILKSRAPQNASKIEYVEERYTTKMAHNQLHELGKAPSQNRKIVDQMAAVNILENSLKSLSPQA